MALHELCEPDWHGRGSSAGVTGEVVSRVEKIRVARTSATKRASRKCKEAQCSVKPSLWTDCRPGSRRSPRTRGFTRFSCWHSWPRQACPKRWERCLWSTFVNTIRQHLLPNREVWTDLLARHFGTEPNDLVMLLETERTNERKPENGLVFDRSTHH